ncbi:DUF3810 domain-containing protein [Chryseobacterium sp. MP_3.2]|uniref:DUF3810 domain-containing protein n=1 Tax=Chryseobacterium sp. MP_3.2 TaxID=3071712 RepID=UPI002DFF6FA5|nr:hypothetical protein [Chryseobacterium sp. MP_3.2]
MADIKIQSLYKKKRFWAGILLAQFLLFWILSKFTFFISLMESFFEFQKSMHQKLFSFFPFSMGDVFYISICVFLLFTIVKIINKKSRHKWIFNLLLFANVFYFFYQIFWGVLYFQNPLNEKLPQEEVLVIERKELALQYLKKCKVTRNLVSEDSNGVFQIKNLERTKSQILKEQEMLPTFINDKKSTEELLMKPSLFHGVMSYTGILGYYNPFTAEAQYNAELPAIYLPFTLAHESAHQLGYAREQEANFMAYLLGKDAENVDLKYSTEYYVLKSILNSLAEEDVRFVEQILTQYSPGMKRDRLAEKDFREKHEGLLDFVFGYTNDLFLKGNQQEGSITYSYFVDLVVRYERL